MYFSEHEIIEQLALTRGASTSLALTTPEAAFQFQVICVGAAVCVPAAGEGGRAFTVMVAGPPVKPPLRVQFASCTETRVYVVLEVTGLVNTLNGVPLVTLLAVRFAVPSL